MHLLSFIFILSHFQLCITRSRSCKEHTREHFDRNSICARGMAFILRACVR